MAKNKEEQPQNETNEEDSSKSKSEFNSGKMMASILEKVDFSMVNDKIEEVKKKQKEQHLESQIEQVKDKPVSHTEKKKALKSVQSTLSDFDWVWQIGFQMINIYFTKYDIKPLSATEQKELKGSLENVVLNSIASSDLKIVQKVAKITQKSDFVQLGYVLFKILVPRFLQLGQKRAEGE